MSQTLQAFVHTLRFEAEDIIGIELRPVGGAEFPAFEAGSHIDLHLPNGLVRSYSLLNTPGETHRYVVAVLKDKASRGGSRCVHDQLRVGLKLTIDAPRNNFPLHEDAGHTVLVAGGIGVTPILCMGRRLQQLGLEPLYNIEKNPLPWLDEMLNAVEHTNFFENRSTEYSKASTIGTWEEAFDEDVQGRGVDHTGPQGHDLADAQVFEMDVQRIAHGVRPSGFFGDADQQLAVMVAGEQAVQRIHSPLQPVIDVDLPLDLAAVQPGSHLGDHLAGAVGVVQHQEALDVEAMGDDPAEVRRRRHTGGVIGRDQAADSHPAVGLQTVEDRDHDVAADILEIDVDPLGRRAFEFFCEV